MDLRTRVGLNVQKLRRDRKLSQEELAARAQVNQSYLSDIERGIRNPSLMVLDRIARALSVDAEEILRKRTGGASKLPNSA
jgi:transcriptional regulator with XRE-family HTH domain